MKNNSLIHKIDKNVISFLEKVTEKWQNNADLLVLYDLLNGKKVSKDKKCALFRVGSTSRIGKTAYKLGRGKAQSHDEFFFQIYANEGTFYMDSYVKIMGVDVCVSRPYFSYSKKLAIRKDKLENIIWFYPDYKRKSKFDASIAEDILKVMNTRHRITVKSWTGALSLA